MERIKIGILLRRSGTAEWSSRRSANGGSTSLIKDLRNRYTKTLAAIKYVNR